MENLWKKRRPPTPLTWDNLPGKDDPPAQHSGLPDQRVWSVHECAQVEFHNISDFFYKKQISLDSMVISNNNKCIFAIIFNSIF